MLNRLMALMSALMIAGLLSIAPGALAQVEDKAEGEVEKEVDLENTLYMDVIYGRIVIELYPEIAPNHVERIKTLTRQKFYDLLYFHRVIDGFMAQTGDPNGDGTGGSDLPDLQAEFSDLKHEKGSLAMARSDDPNSGNSQFFIVFSDTGASHLDGNYTIWGKVTHGQRYVNRLQKGPGDNGSFLDPINMDRILRLRVAADVKAENLAKKEAAEAAEQEKEE